MRTLITIIMLAFAGIASASESNAIPEIIVTADLRQDTNMQTPSSVAVLTEEVIESRAAQHFEDILGAVPNLNFAAGTNRPRFFQIRGIGERSQFVNPINPSVGVLLDDVDFSGAGTIATMADVQQVEVLRGPQGTRYGANALAGLINITTNPPTDEFTLSARAGFAEYGTQDLQLVIGGPMSEQMNGRFVVATHDSDGYIENDHLGSSDTNGRNEATVRGRIDYAASDNWLLSLTVGAVDIDNGYDAFSLDNTRHTLSDEPGFDRQDTRYVAARSEWQGNTVRVEALLNMASSDIDYGYDEDWTFDGIHPFGYASTDHYLRDRTTRSAEVRILSGENGRVFAGRSDWVVGIYHLASREDLLRRYTFAEGDFRSNYDFDTLALFAELDSPLSERLSLTTGLRLERRDTEYRDSDDLAFSPRDDLWGGKMALAYQSSANTMMYGSIARGYKAGGFNTDGTLSEELRTFDDEYLIEYELGVKARFADGAAQLQLAVFFDDRRDQQVKSSIVEPRPDGSTEFTDFLGNAAEGTNRGVEANLDWAISDHFRLNVGVGWLDATFDEFINEFGEDLSGRDQAHAPNYMYSLALNYERGPWQFAVNLDGKDKFYFSDRHSVQSEEYTLLGASLGYTAEQFGVTLWGRNLTDEDYYTRAFGSFGNDPRKDYVTEPYYQFGEPRIVGVTFEYALGNP